MTKKAKKTLNALAKIYGENALEKIEGLDDAVIGVDVITNRLIYSVKKCVGILKRKMTTEEAIDFFYADIFSEKATEQKVIFCEDYLIKKPNI
jgi:hypothetical protein